MKKGVLKKVMSHLTEDQQMFKKEGKEDAKLKKQVMKAVPKEEEMKKKPPLGSGARFKAIEKKAKKAGYDNPAAVAASIGIKKYGKKKMAEMASKGRKKK